MSDTYPRQYARTRRFSLGEPRSFRISPSGNRIAFLRSESGSDPVGRLWFAERGENGAWTERLAFDPLSELGSSEEKLPQSELARRERMREQSSGITAYDVDNAFELFVFALSGQVVLFDARTNASTVLGAKEGAYDPRLSPDGAWVAYVANGSLHLIGTGASDSQALQDRVLAGDPDETVSWGIADFNAAEEFNRMRGFWWSPDSRKVIACRVDESPVQTWFIADPANPGTSPRPHRYPVAGTANAIVSLSILSVDSGSRIDVALDHDQFPYILHVQWTPHALTCVTLNRAQNALQVLEIDPHSGSILILDEQSDDVWVELFPGTPLIVPGGLLLTTETFDDGDTLSLVAKVDGKIRRLSPAGLQVRRLVGTVGDTAYIVATPSMDVAGVAADPASTSIFAISISDPISGPISDPIPDSAGPSPVCYLPESSQDLILGMPAPGLPDEKVTMVIRTSSLSSKRITHEIVEATKPPFVITNLAEESILEPRPQFFRTSKSKLPALVQFPSPGSPYDNGEPLPVLMDPYGGPHAQRVVRSHNAHASSQWFADQGFCVIVGDGRGTPGLGPKFEKAVHNDLAAPPLEDQIEVLHDAATRFDRIDLSRVAIRGWSFGGYLAALAVLMRPDVFHVAVAGAPVTNWRLYDTGYTERYLGHPDTNTAAYEASSLLPLASRLERPLLLIHGLADDNVVAAHTLQLSGLLLAHGKAHEVLPLTGVTHMTPQEEVAENLLLLQVDFIKRHLKALAGK